MIPQPPKDDPRILVVDDIGARRAFYDATKRALDSSGHPVLIEIQPIRRAPDTDIPKLANNRKERRAFGSNKKRRLFRP